MWKTFVSLKHFLKYEKLSTVENFLKCGKLPKVRTNFLTVEKIKGLLILKASGCAETIKYFFEFSEKT